MKEKQTIVHELEAKGWTEADIASYTGKTTKSVQYWRNGTHNPIGENLRKLQELLRKSPKGMEQEKSEYDNEKEALRDLVNVQKQIIAHWKEIMVAQALRHEYVIDQVLRQQARILVRIEPSLKGSDPEELYKELKADVEDRIKKDHSRMSIAG